LNINYVNMLQTNDDSIFVKRTGFLKHKEVQAMQLAREYKIAQKTYPSKHLEVASVLNVVPN